jgi:hypothetical protein
MSNGLEENTEKVSVGAKGRSKDRSPNYPMIDLGKALEKAEIIHGIYKMHEMPIGMAHERLGYKPHSGIGNQCVAALRAYGLLNVIGQGEQRKVSISTDGDRIIRKAPNRDQLLKEAALRPAINGEIWEHFSSTGGIPTDDLLRHYLVWDRPDPKFNEKSVDGFIADFRATLALAKMEGGGIIGDEKEDNRPPEPKVGDYVQWAPEGVPKFSQPKKVLALSDDGLFAYVEDEEIGLSMTALAVQNGQTEAVAVVPPVNPFYKPKPSEEELQRPGVVKLVLPLVEGQVVLTIPDTMSKDSAENLKTWMDLMVGQALKKAGVEVSRKIQVKPSAP